MATSKITTLASKDDEREALAKIAEAVKAVDSSSYLARFFSPDALAWFNRQVTDDMNTDLAEENIFNAGQVGQWKTQANLAQQRADTDAERAARELENAQKETAQVKATLAATEESLKAQVYAAREGERIQYDNWRRAKRELAQAQAELEAMKAQIKAQTMKAKAALGVLAALVVED